MNPEQTLLPPVPVIILTKLILGKDLVEQDDVFVFDFLQDGQLAREEFVLKFLRCLPSVHDFQGTFSLRVLIVPCFYLNTDTRSFKCQVFEHEKE